MALTTKDIIKMLPYTEEFKKTLLDQMDAMNADQKFNIVQIVWDTYDAMYQLKLEENTQLAMQAVADGKESLGADFYKRVQEKTAKDMQQQATQIETSSGISDAREKLEALIKETN